MADTQRPVVILHGYSDKPESADQWRRILREQHKPTVDIHVGG